MSQTSQNSRRRAVLALVSACLAWGLGFPLLKALTSRAELLAPGIDSWFVSSFVIALRFSIAGLVLCVLQPVLPSRRELQQGLALGVCTGIGMVLQADGLAYTHASTSAFLTQGYVLLLPGIAALSTRRWPPMRVLLCAALAVLGLGILSGFEPRTLSLGRGEAETLGAALCFTVQILLLDHKGFAESRTAPVTNVMFFAIAAVSAPLALGTFRERGDAFAVVATAPSLVLFLALLVLPTLLSFVLMNRFQRVVTASEAGIIYGMEPVFASLFALALPAWLSSFAGIAYENEVLGARLLLGGGLVVTATLGLSLSAGRGERQAASSSATA